MDEKIATDVLHDYNFTRKKQYRTSEEARVDVKYLFNECEYSVFTASHQNNNTNAEDLKRENLVHAPKQPYDGFVQFKRSYYSNTANAISNLIFQDSIVVNGSLTIKSARKDNWNPAQRELYERVMNPINGFYLGVCVIRSERNTLEYRLRKQRLLAELYSGELTVALFSTVNQPQNLVWLSETLLETLTDPLIVCYLELISIIYKRFPQLADLCHHKINVSNPSNSLNSEKVGDAVICSPDRLVYNSSVNKIFNDLKQLWAPISLYSQQVLLPLSSSNQAKYCELFGFSNIYMSKASYKSFAVLVIPPLPLTDNIFTDSNVDQLKVQSLVSRFNLFSQQIDTIHVIKYKISKISENDLNNAHMINAWINELGESINQAVSEHKRKFPGIPIILIGWLSGCTLAYKIFFSEPESFNGIVFINFPTNTEHRSQDNFVDTRFINRLNIPIIFIVSSDSKLCSTKEVNELRTLLPLKSHMMVVLNCDDLLLMKTESKRRLLCTQEIVDLMIVENISQMVFNYLNMNLTDKRNFKNFTRRYIPPTQYYNQINHNNVTPDAAFASNNLKKKRRYNPPSSVMPPLNSYIRNPTNAPNFNRYNIDNPNNSNNNNANINNLQNLPVKDPLYLQRTVGPNKNIAGYNFSANSNKTTNNMNNNNFNSSSDFSLPSNNVNQLQATQLFNNQNIKSNNVNQLQAAQLFNNQNIKSNSDFNNLKTISFDNQNNNSNTDFNNSKTMSFDSQNRQSGTLFDNSKNMNLNNVFNTPNFNGNSGMYNLVGSTQYQKMTLTNPDSTPSVLSSNGNSNQANNTNNNRMYVDTSNNTNQSSNGVSNNMNQSGCDSNNNNSNISTNMTDNSGNTNQPDTKSNGRSSDQIGSSNRLTLNIAASTVSSSDYNKIDNDNLQNIPSLVEMQPNPGLFVKLENSSVNKQQNKDDFDRINLKGDTSKYNEKNSILNNIIRNNDSSNSSLRNNLSSQNNNSSNSSLRNNLSSQNNNKSLYIKSHSLATNTRAPILLSGLKNQRKNQINTDHYNRNEFQPLRSNSSIFKTNSSFNVSDLLPANISLSSILPNNSSLLKSSTLLKNPLSSISLKNLATNFPQTFRTPYNQTSSNKTDKNLQNNRDDPTVYTNSSALKFDYKFNSRSNPPTLTNSTGTKASNIRTSNPVSSSIQNNSNVVSDKSTAGSSESVLGKK